MFRKAAPADLDRIAEIYSAIHTEEESGRVSIGWQREIYPTRISAEAALRAGELFVETAGGRIVASARINQEQVAEYVHAQWEHDAPPEQVMVLHTLTVDPAETGKGYGPAFVSFYELYAREHGCPYLRMDTNAVNVRARALYAKLGYREAGIVDCRFNGIPGVHLVCLEKTLS